jgi:hypothetical protein
MKFIALFIISLFLLSVSGCKLTEVKGEIKGVEVSAKEKSKKEDGEGSGFCPPGQAKKGNC